MPEPVVIGVDIGGTTAKLGVVNRAGIILRRAEEIPMPHDQPAEMLVANLIDAIDPLVKSARVEHGEPLGIGVSVCGFVDETGERPEYINVHALDGYPLRQTLIDTFHLPAILDNDMNCAALGEYHFGAGRGVRRLLVMTVGTGIGVGVILNGRVVRTAFNTTGNPGHVVVDPNGPVCVAGCRGCVESLASAGPIARRAEDMARSQRPSMLAQMLQSKGQLTAEDLFHAAEAGDLPAQEIWTEVGKWLGLGLAAWVQIFNPEVVVVGGGVARAAHWLIPPIEQEMRRTGEPFFTSRVREVRKAALEKDLGMLGAATMIWSPEDAPVYRNE